jgi:hypothetical protein
MRMHKNKKLFDILNIVAYNNIVTKCLERAACCIYEPGKVIAG